MVTTLPITSPHVKLPRQLRVTDEQFLQFVKANPDLRLERTATEALIIMSPTGSESGSRLAWLINPKTRTTEIYRLGQPVASQSFEEVRCLI